MTVVVPTLNPVSGDTVEAEILDGYAKRSASTWVDAFLLSGSTTRGDLLSPRERARVVDIWLRHVPANRLIACCWDLNEVAAMEARDVPAMLVMRDIPNPRAALSIFAAMPPGAYIYSHPMYTETVFDSELARMAAEADVLPAGGKIAKIGDLAAITKLRDAAGTSFALWDGSSRRIRESLKAGASGVIATPLSPFSEPFPEREEGALQSAISRVQEELDALPNRAERSEFLMRAAFGA